MNGSPMILLLLALSAVFISGCAQVNLCEQEETYTAMEPYNESVPFIARECANVTVQEEVGADCHNTTATEFYMVESCGRKNYNYDGYMLDPVSGCLAGPAFNCDKGVITCSYMVNNKDDKPGNWTVGVSIRNPTDKITVELGNSTSAVYAGDSQKFSFTYMFNTNTDISLWACDAKVSVPVTENCAGNQKSREVTKEVCTPRLADIVREECREATKYRNEELQKEVQKTRTVKKPC